MIVIRRPIITEKSMKLADKGFYTFEVSKEAVKTQIAKVVSEKFNVKVLKVKTLSFKGERKLQRRVKRFYQTSGIKKAIVQVAKGQKIPIFETPKEEEVISTSVGTEGEPQILKEKKDILRRTKIKVEKGPPAGRVPTTQRKVIPT